MLIRDDGRRTVRLAYMDIFGTPPGAPLHTFSPSRAEAVSMPAAARVVIVDSDDKARAGLWTDVIALVPPPAPPAPGPPRLCGVPRTWCFHCCARGVAWPRSQPTAVSEPRNGHHGGAAATVASQSVTGGRLPVGEKWLRTPAELREYCRYFSVTSL